MDYEITVITLTSQVTTKTSGTRDSNTPFSDYGKDAAVDLQGCQVKTMHIIDGDSALDGNYYTKNQTGSVDTDQVLSAGIVLEGSGTATTLEAGTVITYDFSSLIFRVEDGQITAAYELAFPRIANQSAYMGDLVDDKYSLMVIPVPYTPYGGEEIAPQPFDPEATYQYSGSVTYHSTNPSIDYFQVDCFATGTLIDTPLGPRPVETLREGDEVLTRDHGAQRLVWAGHTQVDAHRLDRQPNLRPICIKTGALGGGLPQRDLVLSPQHRVLVRSRIASRMFDETEILVAAKHLVGLPGIEVMVPPHGVGYHHLLLERHQILRSEGAWTESLYLGPQALKGLNRAARREVTALFPELEVPDFVPDAARRLLSGREGQQLAMRHGKNRKQLFAPVESAALLPA